ncbi:MAG: hypothetical protein QW154_03960 [Sulfolobales archaeon]
MFIRIPFGFSSILEAFEGAPRPPHLAYLMNRFIHAMTSLSPMKPHLGHRSTLLPLSLSLPSHLGHVDEVFLGLTYLVSSPTSRDS